MHDEQSTTTSSQPYFRHASPLIPTIVGTIFVIGHGAVVLGMGWQLFGPGFENPRVVLVLTLLIEIILSVITLGFFVAVVIYSRNIARENDRLFTEMYNTQQKLEASRELYQTIVEDQTDLITRFAPDGTMTFVNQPFCDYFGRERAQLLRRNVRSLLPEHDHDRFQNYLDSLSPQRIARNIVYRFERHAGQVIWQRWRLRAIYDRRSGELSGYQAVGQDITDQKAAEDTVLRTTTRLQFLLSASPAVIYTTEASGNYNPIFVSRNVETLFGHRQVEYWTHDRFWINRIHPDDIDRVLAQRQQLEPDKVVTQDYRFMDGNEQFIWVRDEFRLTTNETGEAVIIGAWVDISDRKADEAELRHTRDVAEAANRAKSSFLATMTHELRTPLNAILGFTQLILAEDELLPQQTLQHMQTIERSGQHLLELINDILEMSRIEAGRVTLNNAVFNIRRLMRDIIDMLTLRADKKGLDLRTHGIQQLPRYIEADEGKIRQVMINLLSNAIKFTAQGYVELRVHYSQNTPTGHENAPTRGRISIEVEDSGQGIAPDELPSVFQPFAQTYSGKRLQEGTGLGLAITREFVRLMDGDITVESQLGRGSTFSCTIVVTEAPAQADGFDSDTQMALRLAPDQPDYRVLVVEDEVSNRELMLRTLKTVGFSVKTAFDGQSAVKIAAEWQPHLIFMDMTMPIMGGVAATQRIREQGSQATIIALTANVFEREQFIAAGCDDFITKPFNRPVLFMKLREHLDVQFAVGRHASDETSPASEGNAVDDFSAVPAQHLDALKRAATKLDVQAAKACSHSIREISPRLADKIDELIASFRFDLIQTLITDIEEGTRS